MSRTSLLVRLDPRVHEALKRWADDELRSVNGQIEFLLRKALRDVGRLKEPADEAGRPRKNRPRPDASRSV